MADDLVPARLALAGPIAANTSDVAETVRQLAATGAVGGDVAAAFDGGSAAFTGQLGGTLRRPVVAGQAEARALAVSGLPPMDVSADVRVDRDRIAFAGGEIVQDGNRVSSVEGHVSFSDTRIQARAQGLVTAFGPWWDALDWPRDWQPDGRLEVVAEIDGRVTRPRVRAAILGSVAVRTLEPSPVSAHLTFEDRRLTLDDARLETAAGTVTGEGTIDLSDAARRFRLEATAAVRDGEKLMPLLKGGEPRSTEALAPEAQLGPTADASALPAVPPLIAGRWDLRVAADGSLADVSGTNVEVLFEHVDGRIAGLPVRVVEPAVVRRTPDTLAVHAFRVQTGESSLVVDGTLGTGADGIRATSRLRLVDMAPLLDALPGEAPVLDGWLTVSARASGELRRPVLEGSVDGTNLSAAVGGVPAASGIDLALSLREGVLTLDRLTGQWQGATVDVNAHGPLRLLDPFLPARWREWLASPAGQAHLSASIRGLTQDALAPFVSPDTLAAVTGRLSLRATLDADRLAPEAWRGDIVFDEAEVSLAQVPIRQLVPTRLTVGDGRLRIDTLTWAGPGSTITAAGGLTWNGGAPRLDAGVDITADLRMASPFLRPAATGGTADVSLSLAGPIASPLLEGRVLLDAAEFRLRDPRVAVTDVSGTVLLIGDRVQLEGVRGTVNGGALTIAGEARLRGWTLDTAGITLAANNAAVEFPDGLRTEVAADLRLVKRRDDPVPLLSGTVTALRGTYREQFGIASQIFGGRRTAVMRPAASAPSRLDALRLDIGLSTLDDIGVDTNYGRVEAGATLRLQGTVGEPLLEGRVALRQGGTLFLAGNTFRVESGALDFTGGPRLQPQIDLTAQTEVGDTTIRLQVTGTPATVRAELSSENPPLSQTDIVSLLVTGRTVADGGISTQVMGEQVLGYLTGDLLNFAGRAIGLDSVRVDRGPVLDDLRLDSTAVATETDPESRLTLTKNLTREVEVVLSQDLSGSGRLTWLATYRPRRAIAFRIVSLDDEDRTYEFRQELSFGRSATRTAPPAERREPRVTGVSFTGSADGLVPDLRDRLKLDPGDRFDYFTWQDDRERLFEHLHQRGYYEANVLARRRQATTDRGEPGVELTYEVRPGPVGQLVTEGIELPARGARRHEDRVDANGVRRLPRGGTLAAGPDLSRGQGYLRAEVVTAIEARVVPGRPQDRSGAGHARSAHGRPAAGLERQHRRRCPAPGRGHRAGGPDRRRVAGPRARGGCRAGRVRGRGLPLGAGGRGGARVRG